VTALVLCLLAVAAAIPIYFGFVMLGSPFTVLCALLAVAHMADAGSTRWVLKRGSHESNPALAWLDRTITPLPNTGKWLWLLTPKMIVIGLQWAALALYWPDDWVIAMACVTIVAHFGIASRNLNTVRKK